jgi:hypothetical protein
MKRNVVVTVVLLAGLLLLAVLLQQNRGSKPDTGTPSGTNQPAQTLRKVVVNEAARTLLYIPLYYVLESGYFRDAGGQACGCRASCRTVVVTQAIHPSLLHGGAR